MEKKKIGNFCIIGFPDDLAIQNVGGRTGAAAGPDAFLSAFQKLKGREPVQERFLGMASGYKAVEMRNNLESNYRNAILEIQKLRSDHPRAFVVAVGGGHDYAYPWIRAFSETHTSARRRRLGCINIDAHFDLRPTIPVMTSGSPFWRLIEEKWILPKNLIEFGIQSHCNVPELWDYAKKNKVPVIPFERLRNGKAVGEFKRALSSLRRRCDEIFLSVDLDAMSLAFCPGVSSPQGEGFSGSELFQMLELAGSDKKVTSLGIFELSPRLDFQDQTARVAAQGAWHFLQQHFLQAKGK